MPTEHLTALPATALCSFRGCNRSARIGLAEQTLCRDHLLSICEVRLEAVASFFEYGCRRRADLKSVRLFITECAEAVNEFMQSADDLAPNELAALIDTQFRVKTLLRRLPANVILRHNSAGCFWENIAEIKGLSRDGAVLRCRYPAEIKTTLTMIRADTGKQLTVQVMICQPQERRYELTVSFMGSNDHFFELTSATGLRFVTESRSALGEDLEPTNKCSV